MIPNGKKWHYLSVKKVLPLLRGITSKHYGDFFCLTCLHSFRTKNKLQLHKRVCENKDFCNVIMPSLDTEILEYNKYQKYDGCKNNPENSSRAKVGEHISSAWKISMMYIEVNTA